MHMFFQKKYITYVHLCEYMYRHRQLIFFIYIICTYIKMFSQYKLYHTIRIILQLALCSKLQTMYIFP